MNFYLTLIDDDFVLLPTIIIHTGDDPGAGIAWLSMELGIAW